MITPQDSRELWMQARALGGNPGGDWTFPLFFWRARASRPDGLDVCYEDLTTWEQLSALVDLNQALSELGHVASNGYSIGLGLNVFDEAYYALEGRLSLPAPDEPFRGRHVVRLIGMEDESTLVFVNSWGGTRWGRNGLGYITRAYFENHVDSVVACRSAKFGPSLAMDRELKRRSWVQGRPGIVLMDDVGAAWLTPNRTFGKSVLLRGEMHDLTGRKLFSADDQPFEIVELRLGNHLVGRVHIRHSSRESVVTEFWVPREARRKGYGSQLLRVIEEFAARHRDTRIQILLHEADETGLDASYSFAQNRGYLISVNESKRPNLSAIATRALTTTR